MKERRVDESYLRLKADYDILERKSQRFAQRVHIITIATALGMGALGEYIGKQKCLEQKQNSGTITDKTTKVFANDSVSILQVQGNKLKLSY